MAVAIGGSLTIRRVTRHAFAGGRVLPPTTSVEYVQTDRRRDEHRGFSGYRVRANGADIYRLNPHTALIKRCDLQKTFLVNFDDRQFTEWPIDPLPTRQELRARAESASAVEPPAPTIRVETETVDTGERKDMFDRPARHVITTQRVVPLGGPARDLRVSVIDGWYIDLDTRLTCEPDWSGLLGHGYLTAHMQGDPPARPMFVRIGEPERGYPVRLKTTDGDSVSEVDVTELSTVPLHPSLFEVSAGFTRVEMIRQEPVPPFVVRLRQAYDRLARRLRIGR
jgi:hypothetical protein